MLAFTLPYLTFGMTATMLTTVSSEALLSYGPMCFPVHRALARIFNHRSIAVGFCDVHLYCASLKTRTHTHTAGPVRRLDRPQTHTRAADPSKQLPKPRHDEQTTTSKAIVLCYPGPCTTLVLDTSPVENDMGTDF